MVKKKLKEVHGRGIVSGLKDVSALDLLGISKSQQEKGRRTTCREISGSAQDRGGG